jgi:hypothetical protein
MEILIAGLILVALMVWASTKIKKRAAEAFESETIETQHYTLEKPDGFLHVIDSPDHDLEAYSKEFDEVDFRLRRAKIEIDVLEDTSLAAVCDLLRQSDEASALVEESDGVCRIETEETANENEFKVFYKLVGTSRGIYRLRFAVVSKHADEYLRRIEETLDSFTIKSI